MGDGQLCGCKFVDERFEALLKQKLNDVGKWSRLPQKYFEEMKDRHWERGIKLVFDHRRQQRKIEIPAVCFDPVEIARLFDEKGGLPDLLITAEDIESLFKPIFSKIFKMIEAQIMSKNGRRGLGLEPKVSTITQTVFFSQALHCAK